MVNSVLHVICGNCGNGSPESMSVQTFFDDDAGRLCAAITCKVCSTMHYLTAATDSSTEALRARVAELEDANAELGCEANKCAEQLRDALAEKAELEKDRERLKKGCALTAEGWVIHNIHEVMHESEDWQCCMMAMDDAGVPRADDDGVEYSIWGRACWMLRSGDPLYQSDGQAIDAARKEAE